MLRLNEKDDSIHAVRYCIVARYGSLQRNFQIRICIAEFSHPPLECRVELPY